MIRISATAILLLCIVSITKGDDNCSNNGVENNGTCICNPGFIGNKCQHCQGRFVLNDTSGSISDGPGSTHFSNCLGIISSPHNSNNSVVRLRFDNVAISCHCDFLTVYDGDSLYAPILATFNGDILPSQTQELVSSSSTLAFRFYNDGTDFVEPGYHITYSVEEKSSEDPSLPAPNISCSDNDAWCRYSWAETTYQGRTSSAAVKLDEHLYVFGGLQFGQEQSAESQFMRLSLSSFEWSEDWLDAEFTNTSSVPDHRQGHIMVAWKDMLIIHGGALLGYSITNEVWNFNTTENQWQKVEVNSTGVVPHLIGHSAHVINDTMLVFFGYSPYWEISNFLFEMDLATNEWKKINTTGASPKATYKHASALDESNSVVYVHGGFDYIGSSNKLYSYDVVRRLWTILPSSPRSAHLHSAVMLGVNLYVFGGKTERDCNTCPELNTIKFNIECMEWSSVDEDYLIASDRYGHSSIQFNQTTMLVYGGYDGTILGDIITYTEPDWVTYCKKFSNVSECNINSDCIWNGAQCSPGCDKNETVCQYLCSAQDSSCSKCVSTSCACCFNDRLCAPLNATAEENNECHTTDCIEEDDCYQMLTCDACAEADCLWQEIGDFCTHKNVNQTSPSCRDPCSIMNNCGDCVSQSECSWCRTTETCFRHGTTAIYFPYGQCLEYDDILNSCASDFCSHHGSCDACFNDYHCGWCDIDSNTGSGTCFPGSLDGPNDHNCDPVNWQFERCPACQCNGHSNCSASEPSVCTSCEEGTRGEKCGECDTLYYGNAVNGMQCIPCECNGHAEDCSTYGDCYCDVEGMAGRNCDSCFQDFNGDAANDTCRFTMKVMTKYNFPLYQQSSSVNKFNFEACPPYTADVTINIEISQNKSVDVIIETNTTTELNETVIGNYSNVTTLELKLHQYNYHFGQDSNRCLRIYVSNIDKPLKITIWLYQPYINIWKLVAIFLLTLISLLLVAGLLWKIYIVIMRARRRRVIQVEMERLAARPMSAVNLDTEDLYSTAQIKQGSDEQEAIKMVGEERCINGRAAVCTTLLWLPNQDIGSRIAFGSCLVTCSHPAAEDDVRKGKSTRRNQASGIDNPNYTPESA